MVASCNKLHACRGQSGVEARDKCPHVIVSQVYNIYMYMYMNNIQCRECGNLHAVILEVKVVMNESLEM